MCTLSVRDCPSRLLLFCASKLDDEWFPSCRLQVGLIDGSFCFVLVISFYCFGFSEVFYLSVKGFNLGFNELYTIWSVQSK